MKSVVLLIFLFLFGIAGVSADPVRNGGWWTKLNDFQRQAYVTGVFDGIPATQTMMSGDNVSATVVWNQSKNIQHLFQGLTSDEVIRKVSQFYEDRRNKSVFTSDAIILVAMEQKLMSRDQHAMFEAAVVDARRRGAKGWPK